jgi:hypothetical protein
MRRIGLARHVTAAISSKGGRELLFAGFLQTEIMIED